MKAQIIVKSRRPDGKVVCCLDCLLPEGLSCFAGALRVGKDSYHDITESVDPDCPLEFMRESVNKIKEVIIQEVQGASTAVPPDNGRYYTATVHWEDGREESSEEINDVQDFLDELLSYMTADCEIVIHELGE